MGTEYRELGWALGYRFGDDGSAFSNRKNGEWRILTPSVMPKGYRILHLSGIGTRLLHRLILEAFRGPCPEGMEGCHNDGNPANNTLDNLRWDTPQNNVSDMVRHGTHTKGFQNGAAKLKPEDIELISKLRTEGLSYRKIGEIIGVHGKTVNRAHMGWTYGK